jgi:hypothetical protein
MGKKKGGGGGGGGKKGGKRGKKKGGKKGKKKSRPGHSARRYAGPTSATGPRATGLLFPPGDLATSIHVPPPTPEKELTAALGSETPAAAISSVRSETFINRAPGIRYVVCVAFVCENGCESDRVVVVAVVVAVAVVVQPPPRRCPAPSADVLSRDPR